MQREQGMIILKEKEDKRFERIVLDVANNEDEAIVYLGTISSNDKYYLTELGNVLISQIAPLEKSKKLIKKVLKQKCSKLVENGFPEIAITERLKEILSEK